MKQKYKLNDLTIRPTNRQRQAGQSIAHTHSVEFERSLTQPEQQQFKRLIVSFYDVVHFSRHYGNGLRAEPEISFSSSSMASYTLYQQGSSGPWKDLLFAMLATFSLEIAGIANHDGNPVFASPQKKQQLSETS